MGVALGPGLDPVRRTGVRGHRRRRRHRRRRARRPSPSSPPTPIGAVVPLCLVAVGGRAPARAAAGPRRSGRAAGARGADGRRGRDDRPRRGHPAHDLRRPRRARVHRHPAGARAHPGGRASSWPACARGAPTDIPPFLPPRAGRIPAERDLGLPDAGPAPELRGISATFNTGDAPLTLAAPARARGAARLLDLLLHQLPAHDPPPRGPLRALPRRRPDGARRPHARVRASRPTPGTSGGAVGDLGITYPVALDPDFATWDAFGNRYWPATYLIDRDGHVRDLHIGEGDEARTESLVRRAARRRRPTSPRPPGAGRRGAARTAGSRPPRPTSAPRGSSASPPARGCGPCCRRASRRPGRLPADQHRLRRRVDHRRRGRAGRRAAPRSSWHSARRASTWCSTATARTAPGGCSLDGRAADGMPRPEPTWARAGR